MKGEVIMEKVTFTPIEEIALRNEVDRQTALGLQVASQEACKVCSTELLSLTIVTNKGTVRHLSCPCCGQRDIIPTLKF